MQHKIKLLNKDQYWSRLKNYRPNDVVNHNDKLWQNVTGLNTEPIDSSLDWIDVTLGIEGSTDKTDIVEKDNFKPVESNAVFNYAIKKINTIADLRNTIGEDEGQIVSLLGYYEAGDKESLNYKWTSTQGVDDGGSIINSGSGSWVLDTTDTISIKDFGAKDDILFDSTSHIQKCLNFNKVKTKYFNKGNYLSGQLIIPSNINIICDKNLLLLAKNNLIQTLPNFEVLLRFQNSENVIFDAKGANFKMNKDSYSGEHNHIFMLNGATNIEIKNANAKDSGGDGFFIGGLNSAVKTYSENIKIINCSADNNRRQGMSIVGVDNIEVDTFTAINTIGTAPQAGIDLEPNNYNERFRNIKLKNIISKFNKGIGIEMALFNIRENADGGDINISIDNSIIESNNTYGVQIWGAPEHVKGNIYLNKVVANSNYYSGFLERGVTNNLKVIYNNCAGINNNTSNTSGRDSAFNSNFVIQGWNNEKAPLNIGNSIYNDCISIGDNSTKIRRGFGMSNSHVLGVFKNVEFNRCTSINHLDQDIYIDSLVQDAVINRLDKTILPKIANYDIKNSDTCCEFNNKEADKDIILRLPIAVKGLKFTIKVESSFYIIITTQTGSIILGLMRFASSGVSNNKIGNKITLIGREDGNWEVVEIVGRWSASDVGITANRPLSPKTGEFYFNQTTGLPEWYNGTDWQKAYKQSIAVSNITANDATDLDSALTLVNELKVKLNAKLTADRNSGQQEIPS